MKDSLGGVCLISLHKEDSNLLLNGNNSVSGSRTHERLQQFTRFTLSVQSQHAPNNPAAKVGYYQLFSDALTTFNEDCINTISEASDFPKTEVNSPNNSAVNY